MMFSKLMQTSRAVRAICETAVRLEKVKLGSDRYRNYAHEYHNLADDREQSDCRNAVSGRRAEQLIGQQE